MGISKGPLRVQNPDIAGISGNTCKTPKNYHIACCASVHRSGSSFQFQFAKRSLTEAETRPSCCLMWRFMYMKEELGHGRTTPLCYCESQKTLVSHALKQDCREAVQQNLMLSYPEMQHLSSGRIAHLFISG